MCPQKDFLNIIHHRASLQLEQKCFKFNLKKILQIFESTKKIIINYCNIISALWICTPKVVSSNLPDHIFIFLFFTVKNLFVQKKFICVQFSSWKQYQCTAVPPKNDPLLVLNKKWPQIYLQLYFNLEQSYVKSQALNKAGCLNR
jgi:hypothetical protein